MSARVHEAVAGTGPTIEHAIADLATRRLQQSPHRALHTLTCHYHEGMLTLRGRLPTFYTKQVAFAEVLKVDGVEMIVDRIEVHSQNS